MAASKENFRVKWGGAWRIADPQVKVSGQWKQVKEVHVKQGGVWQHAYVFSDPIIESRLVDWTNCYGEGHLQQPEWTMTPIGYSAYQGDWDTVGHSSGMQRTRAILKWNLSGGWYDVFDGRDSCSNAQLRLTIRAQYTSNGIHPSIWIGNEIMGGKPSSLSSVPSADNQTIGSRETTDTTFVTSIPTVIGDRMAAGQTDFIQLYHSGQDTASKELYRGAVYDETDSTNVQPELQLTMDYS